MKLERQGFTLLEALIVITVMVILVTMSVPFFSSALQERAFERSSEEIEAALRLARGKALAYESGLTWGVRFTNSTTDSYMVFSTPSTYDSVSTTLLSTTILTNGVYFVSPEESASTTVYFSPLYGTSSPGGITLGSVGGRQSMVTVTADGLVY